MLPLTTSAVYKVCEAGSRSDAERSDIAFTLHRKGVTTGAIIIAEIVLVHIHEGVATKSPHGKTIVDIDKYEPSCRIGGNMWCKVKEVFELIRPNDKQMQKRQEEFHKQVR